MTQLNGFESFNSTFGQPIEVTGKFNSELRFECKPGNEIYWQRLRKSQIAARCVQITQIAIWRNLNGHHLKYSKHFRRTSMSVYISIYIYWYVVHRGPAEHLPRWLPAYIHCCVLHQRLRTYLYVFIRLSLSTWKAGIWSNNPIKFVVAQHDTSPHQNIHIQYQIN